MTESNAETVEVYETDDGWRWRARAGNGETVASGEAHTRSQDAIRAALGAFPAARLKLDAETLDGEQVTDFSEEHVDA